MTALIEDCDLTEVLSGSSKYRSVERVHRSVILTVDAEVWVELGLFDDNIGQPTFTILTADTDVKIVL
jgi:hypothetical protein